MRARERITVRTSAPATVIETGAASARAPLRKRKSAANKKQCRRSANLIATPPKIFHYPVFRLLYHDPGSQKTLL